VGYLLQRMESFHGLAILTTNARSALDPAFTRRLRSIITFPYQPGFAVQIARWHGAYVIGTASAENRDFLLGLGANEVIDYQHVRFEEAVRDVDVVLDTIGGGTRERSWQVLKPGGIMVSLPEPIPKGDAAAHGQRGVFFIVRPDREQLGRLATLIDSGPVRPVIAQTVPLPEAREAFERGVAGHTRGKLVLAVDNP